MINFLTALIRFISLLNNPIYFYNVQYCGAYLLSLIKFTYQYLSNTLKCFLAATLKTTFRTASDYSNVCFRLAFIEPSLIK